MGGVEAGGVVRAASCHAPFFDFAINLNASVPVAGRRCATAEPTKRNGVNCHTDSETNSEMLTSASVMQEEHKNKRLSGRIFLYIISSATYEHYNEARTS